MKIILWKNGEVTYHIKGLLGCLAQSEEPATVIKGDVRLIAGKLMFAYDIKRAPLFSLKGDIVKWASVDPKETYDSIQEWVKGISDENC